MKQIIVLIGTVILGIYLFGLMITNDDSLFALSKDVLIKSKEAYICMN